MEPARLRLLFRGVNRFMVALWRLGLGGWVNAWPALGGRVMVLVHVGRRSGLRRRTPLNYALVEGDVYCTAGFGPGSDWYRNVLASPGVEVWLPDGWWAGTARDVSDSAQRLALVRQVLVASGFAARVAGIRPRTIADGELARRTAGYRLLRIECTHALTGPGGPGDRAWVWPLAALVLCALLLLG